MNLSWERLSGRLAWAIAAGAATLVIIGMALSLRWQVDHDLPIMLYDGWLVFGAGLAPYRQVFEMNPPGTFLVYGTIDALTHGRNLPVRLFDIASMFALSGLTMLALRRHGPRAGLIAASVFLAGYLKLGQQMALQREYLVLLPLALSLTLALEARVQHARRHQFVLGMLAAAVASVKPSLGLGWLVLSAGLCAREWSAAPAGVPRLRGALAAALSFVAGAGVVGVSLWVFLARMGAVPAFVQVVRDYWPLYAQLDGHAYVAPVPGVASRVLSIVLGAFGAISHVPFTLAAGAGAFALALHATDRERRIEVCVLAALLFVVALHVSLSNKYWPYHYLPVRYVVALLAGVCFSARWDDVVRRAWPALLVPVALLACGVPLSEGRGQAPLHTAHAGGSARTADVKEADVDVITRYLREHLQPGDRVLPLDVTGGAVHAMYRTHTRLAGRFLYDFHFYHHVSSPMIQALRQEIVDQVERQPARLVVRFHEPWRPSGEDCAADFPALDSALTRGYRVALTSGRFEILERLEH